MMSLATPSPAHRDLQRPGRDRRRHMRHRAQTAAFAGMNGNSTGIVLDLHQILDLSEDGMSFLSTAQMEVGETLNFSVDLSNPKAYFHTLGRVVWSNVAGRTGVRFHKMFPEDASQLKEWLFENALAGAATEQTASDVVEEPRLAPQPQLVPTAVEPGVAADFKSYTSALLATEGVKTEVETQALDLDATLKIVVERTLVLTGSTGAAIALSTLDAMVCRATAGQDAPPLEARLEVGSGFSGECIRTGQLLYCQDCETDPRVDPESCRALGIRSIMAAPIRSSDVVIGLIEIFAPVARTFSESDETILQRMAEIVLAAVHRAIQAVEGTAATAPQPAAAQPVASPERLLAVDEDQMQAPVAAPESPISVSPEPAEPVFTAPAKRSRISWLLAIAIGIGVLVGLWFLVAGIREASSSSADHPVTPAAATVRPRLLDVSSLDELKTFANSGDEVAEFDLGLRYATGSDVPQDYAEAVHWFSQAAEKGHVLAQSTLGAYYWAGRGVPQDFNKAYFWALLAQSGGDDASRARVPFLASRMNRSDILAIQQQANDWTKLHRSGKPTPVRQ
jgi:GAF domain-containing protein